MFDLVSEVQGFDTRWGKLDFFSHSKASDANIDIIANVVCFLKTLNWQNKYHFREKREGLRLELCAAISHEYQKLHQE